MLQLYVDSYNTTQNVTTLSKDIVHQKGTTLCKLWLRSTCKVQ